jgi:hypothetical protein
VGGREITWPSTSDACGTRRQDSIICCVNSHIIIGNCTLTSPPSQTRTVRDLPPRDCGEPTKQTRSSFVELISAGEPRAKAKIYVESGRASLFHFPNLSVKLTLHGVLQVISPVPYPKTSYHPSSLGATNTPSPQKRHCALRTHGILHYWIGPSSHIDPGLHYR